MAKEKNQSFMQIFCTESHFLFVMLLRKMSIREDVLYN